MGKLAVVTIAIGESYKAIAALTHPTLSAYASKIGAEFVVIDERKVSSTSPHFEKFQMFDLLNKYERILYLDTDIIVRADCPNLFDVVPQSLLGAFDEGKILDRTAAMQQVCMDYKEEIPKWDRQYYNTGVMVVSRRHKELFRKPEKELWNFYEQSWLNLRIVKDGIRVFPLDYKFNRMSCMDAVTGEHRLSCPIVHYAGVLSGLDPLIKLDLARWDNGEWLKFKRRVVIGVGNSRLGDNISAEPIVRYIVDNTPTGTEFTIACTHPEVFSHMADRASLVRFDQLEYDKEFPAICMNCAVEQGDARKEVIDGERMSMTDFLSLTCIKRVLPNAAKWPRLQATDEGRDELAAALGGASIEDLILVHPGRSWPSKTFPKEWWDEVIDLAPGPMAIIGADVGDQLGTVDVEVPFGTLDLRNLLSTAGLFAAISGCRCLVSNDSGPVHVAIAFNKRIVLIPTCKHPDFIFPPGYANGVALGNRLSIDEPFDPSNPKGSPIYEPAIPLTECLPDPRDVAERIRCFSART